MTVTVSTNSVTWLGNGATTVFSYTFCMPAASDATLLYTTAAGVQTTVAPSAYTITGVGQPTAGGGPQGGTVTYAPGGSPIPAGSLLTLIRTIPDTQPNSFSNQGGLWASVVEASDDNLAMQIQQVAGGVARALQFNPADAGPFPPLPPAVLRADQLLGFDGNGNPITAQPSNALISTAMQPVVLSASTSAALAALGVTAMQPVVNATSLQNGLDAIFQGQTLAANMFTLFSPQGNPTTALGSLVVAATTQTASVFREFLGSFNLYSNIGSGEAGTGTTDKVALYAGVEGVAGSCDIWSVNSLTSMDSTFPATSYALGYELDFNNFANGRGATVGTAGFSGATATGLLVSGSSTYTNTSAISIEGVTSYQWQRGVSVVNAVQASFFDWTSATCGLISYGSHTYGIDLNPMALVGGGQAIRVANSQALASRNGANSGDIPLIYLNSANGLTIGGAAVAQTYMGIAPVTPGSDDVAVLGSAGLRWASVWSANGTIQTSDPELKTDIQPLPEALPIVQALQPVSYKWKIGGYISEATTATQLVHATEEQEVEEDVTTVVGGKATVTKQMVKRTVHLYDHVPVVDATGAPVVVVVPAKPATETTPAVPARSVPKTHQVARMVEAAVPTTTMVPRAGQRTHWGFLAPDVREAFAQHGGGRDFGGYVKAADGSQHLRPDQLVPVLWKAVQELSARVDRLASLITR